MWHWFRDLDATRDRGFDRERLKYREIAAWASLMQVTPTPREIRIVMALDAILWDIVHETPPADPTPERRQEVATNLRDFFRAKAEADKRGNLN